MTRLRRAAAGFIVSLGLFGFLTWYDPCRFSYARVKHTVIATVYAQEFDTCENSCTCANGEGSSNCWSMCCAPTSWGCGLFWLSPCNTEPCYGPTCPDPVNTPW